MSFAKTRVNENSGVKTLIEKLCATRQELERAETTQVQAEMEVARKSELLANTSDELEKKIAERIKEYLEANNVTPSSGTFIPENWHPLGHSKKNHYLPEVYLSDLDQLVLVSTRQDWSHIDLRDIYLPENLMLLAFLEHLGIDLT